MAAVPPTADEPNNRLSSSAGLRESESEGSSGGGGAAVSAIELLPNLTSCLADGRVLLALLHSADHLDCMAQRP